ncbi:MAG: aldehyde reductase [Actinobacteria bacterium]|nr:aldehyde reductase [Actinomycetota bacterium]
MAIVLVTGGSGFLGAHLIVRLLADGHDVRATVRTVDRRDDVERMLQAAGAPTGAVGYVETDLLSDEGWSTAMAGADYVLHAASPFPAVQPDDEDEVIRPAREGTLRVLRFALAAGVKRVVVTSSFATIGYGHPPVDRAYTEEDWTDVDGPGVTPYAKSKTLAERAAWDFVAQNPGLELVVVNPVGIFGPALGPDLSTSVQIVQRLLTGGLPVLPPLWSNAVDVRDVADLEVRVMTSPQAAGQRYLAVAGEPISFGEIARTLRDRLGAGAAKVPRVVLPAWVVRLLAPLVPSVRGVVSQLGVVRRASNAKARASGWTPRSNQEAVLATVESLLALG